MRASAPLLADVSDTARWMAYLRGLESERPDALFRDAFALRLAGERGREIAEAMPDAPGAKPGAAGFASLLAVRTRVFDELIADSVRAAEADAVLNLAAGLDARPYRLSLPSSLVWIEADRGAILESKAALLAGEKPAFRVERIAVDLADASARRQLIERVASSHARVVVITEGLLVYLEESVVRSLAAELRAQPAVQRWILEAVAPEVLKRNMGAWGHILRRANAEWKFARADGFDFYAKLGWAPVEKRAFFDESRRLGRGPRHERLLGLLYAASSSFRHKVQNMVAYGVVAPC
jgi:methyltransferase (TIGR00027 family)